MPDNGNIYYVFKLVNKPDEDIELTKAIDALGDIAGELITEPLPIDDIHVRCDPKRIKIHTTFYVGSPYNSKKVKDDPDYEKKHFDDCMTFLNAMVEGLRLATNAKIPNFSLKRLRPFYYVLERSAEQKIRYVSLETLDIGIPISAPPTQERLDLAMPIMRNILNGDKLVIILDCILVAYNSLHIEGNYAQSLLNSAIAAEVLIDELAWTLAWEVSSYSTKINKNKLPTNLPFMPHPLANRVLGPILGDHWKSEDPSDAIGGWRNDILWERNRIMHKGISPTVEQATLALEALEKLKDYLLESILKESSFFPRTAVLFLGIDKLPLSTQAWFKTQFSPESFREEITKLRDAYHAWLEAELAKNEGYHG